jgi:hypothetical protein
LKIIIEEIEITRTRLSLLQSKSAVFKADVLQLIYPYSQIPTNIKNEPQIL